MNHSVIVWPMLFVSVFVAAALLYNYGGQDTCGLRLSGCLQALRNGSDRKVYDSVSRASEPAQRKGQTCECDTSSAVSMMPAGGLTDMLDEMRAAGLKPQLLSRAVPRHVDNVTSHVVPNVVHYVHYGVANGVPFDFQHYLSFRSASQFLKPQYIFLHGDVVPKGEWWTRTLAEVDNLYHVYRKKQTKIHGKKVTFVQHLADFTRLTVTI
ncbi:hypothetical protein LSAT2_028736, partial [Lamellibrachia satsuma]